MVGRPMFGIRRAACNSDLKRHLQQVARRVCLQALLGEKAVPVKDSGQWFYDNRISRPNAHHKCVQSQAHLPVRCGTSLLFSLQIYSSRSLSGSSAAFSLTVQGFV
jgi:hypothetical protein